MIETDEQKDKIVKDLIKAFDFEKVRSIMYLTKRDMHVVPSIKELKEQAEKLIRMTFEHQDREFWWAGGQHHGGLCASYDDKWGFSLTYVAEAKKVKAMDYGTSTNGTTEDSEQC